MSKSAKHIIKSLLFWGSVVFLTWLFLVISGSIVFCRIPGSWEPATTLFGWMADSLGAWKLVLFMLVTGGWFALGFRWVAHRRLLLRVPSFLLVVGVYAALFLGLCNAVPFYYETREFHYKGPTTENWRGEDFQRRVGAMRMLVDQAGFPEDIDGINELHRRGEAFDPMEYFTVLTNLSVLSGFVLDYVHPGLNRCPVLYSREEDAEPFTTYEQLMDSVPEVERNPDGRIDWSEAVEAIGSDDGYLDLAALYLVGDQFYLSWHAGYNDDVIIASKERLEELLNSNDQDLRFRYPGGLRMAAQKLNMAPTIMHMGGNKVRVSLLTFSNWGGFIREELEFSAEYPHRLLLRESKSLIGYHCGEVY